MTTHGSGKVLFLILLSTVMPNSTSAQDGSRNIVIGEEKAIFSETLNEERILYVGKPDSYGQGEESYPVMFVLDGEAHFQNAAVLARFLARNQLVPEMLVVGIGNTERARDMTPPAKDPFTVEQVPEHGGAANFQAFIAHELMPWLDENYRIRPYRILVGHSLGGLFAIESLITRPELFNAYIAISPSLQWDGQQVVQRAEAFFGDAAELHARLFVALGNEGGRLASGARNFSGVLEEKAPADLTWHFAHMPQETHGSVSHHGIYQGLEFIFADWTLRDPFEVYDKYGLDALERFFQASDRKYGFERGMPENILGGIAVQLEGAGRLDEVMDLLSRSDTLQPPPRFLLRVAGRYRQAGRAERAAEVYRQVLESEPGNEAARQALAELGSSLSDPLP